MGKQYTIKVSRKMHDTLEDGSRRTGLSLAEFADKVLQGRVEDRLPLAENPTDLTGVVTGKRSEDGHILSPDGDYQYYEYIECWAKV